MIFRGPRAWWSGLKSDRRCGGLRLGVMLVGAALCCLAFTGALAKDAPPVSVRVGSHQGYGRVVFDLPARTNYQLTQQGEHVALQFTGDLTIGSATGVPHNVVGLTGGASQAEIVVSPGTVVREWRFGDRLVIDVWDQAAAPKTQPVAPEGPRQRQLANHPAQVTPLGCSRCSPAGACSTADGRGCGCGARCRAHRRSQPRG